MEIQSTSVCHMVPRQIYEFVDARNFWNFDFIDATSNSFSEAQIDYFCVRETAADSLASVLFK